MAIQWACNKVSLLLGSIYSFIGDVVKQARVKHRQTQRSRADRIIDGEEGDDQGRQQTITKPESEL